MHSLDPIASASDGSVGPDELEFTHKLSLFGEPAKRQLLQRAAGDDPGWRNLSGAILANWRVWSPSDVPQLRAALQRDPGGWMAGPLRTIGTPEAIEALVEDLPKGSDNQTDFALSKLGPKAIPFLMPLFEGEATSPSAARVFKLMDGSAVPFAQSWSEQAINSALPLKGRLAALRAIGALGAKARPVSGAIEPLLASPDPALREQAAATISAVDSFEQTVDPRAESVSLIGLIADPEKYDRKRVQIIAFLRLEFEGDALYLHRDDLENGITKNGIWLDRPKDLSQKQAEAVDQRYVICEGIFNARVHGHMGLFSGSLTHVNRLEPWK